MFCKPLFCLLQQAQSVLRTNPPFKFEFLVLQFVRGGKEFFQLIARLGGQATCGFQVPFKVRVRGDSEESIVSRFLVLVALNDEECANYVASQDQARRS
jgi:hypothetical protein